MELIKKNDKMVLKCTYSERLFPKTLNARWNAKHKQWEFSASMMTYNVIIEEAKKRNIQLKVDNDLKEFFDNKTDYLKSFSLNKEFKTKQYKHQKLITEFIINKKKCFVFAGVGTGKSKAAIDAVTQLYDFKEVKKVLVVCPSSIMWNFGNEIKIHSYFDYTIISGTLEKRKQLLEDSNTVFDIINYDILSKLEKEIIKKKYDMVIFDEIHKCKSRTTSLANASFKISQSIPIRVGLTGTIISNNCVDLFMPYKIIDSTIFGKQFSKFKSRYLLMGGYMQYEIIGFSHEEEIKKLVASNSIKFEIRDVIDDLPSEKHIIKNIKLSKEAMKIYKDLKTKMIAEYDRGNVVADNVLERILRLSQITSGFLVDKENNLFNVVSTEKIDALKDLLSEITEKTAIFCRFTKSIDLVAELCDKLGISYYIYDGRTKCKDLYLKYNNDDTVVWIAQLQKSEGYSIPNARYCIFYELDYSRTNHVQSKGRILRASGSPHECIFYIYLLAEKTIDEGVYMTLKNKDFSSEKALELVRGLNNE